MQGLSTQRLLGVYERQVFFCPYMIVLSSARLTFLFRRAPLVMMTWRRLIPEHGNKCWETICEYGFHTWPIGFWYVSNRSFFRHALVQFNLSFRNMRHVQVYQAFEWTITSLPFANDVNGHLVLQKGIRYPTYLTQGNHPWSAGGMGCSGTAGGGNPGACGPAGGRPCSETIPPNNSASGRVVKSNTTLKNPLRANTEPTANVAAAGTWFTPCLNSCPNPIHLATLSGRTLMAYTSGYLHAPDILAQYQEPEAAEAHKAIMRAWRRMAVSGFPCIQYTSTGYKHEETRSDIQIQIYSLNIFQTRGLIQHQNYIETIWVFAEKYQVDRINVQDWVQWNCGWLWCR